MERRIASELGIRLDQVRGTLALLDEGNTVPFIARYRKERTGGLDEVQIRDVARLSEQIRQLEDRRQTILSSVEEQGALTAELRRALSSAQTLGELEDLYAPYRPKRQTRATRALEAGLGPVAEAIARGEDPNRLAAQFCTEAYSDVDAVIGGARDILAEAMADDATVRAYVRDKMRRDGRMMSKRRRGGEEDPKYQMYFEFSVPVEKMRPHQVLAIRRGEKEKVLSAGVEVHEDRLVDWIVGQRVKTGGVARKHHTEAVRDGFGRLLHPSLERDVRGELEEDADKHAIGVFALNLKNLLLQPPLAGRVVLGVDPGMRTGCKLAVVDATGRLIDTGHMYVHDGRKRDAPDIISAMVHKHGVEVVAIGNGTGSRETEELVARGLRGKDGVHYAIVDEAGASVYSASEIARAEFPDLDVSVRGAVSIARRIQDPLAELVKIDPKSIGVGMYQHDVNQNALSQELDAVVEDVVNAVGVDVNSASQPLLARVAGIGPTLSKRIVAHRDATGPFASRASLKDVRGLGARTFEQCAGFLRVRQGREPLDDTGIHPESYALARDILKLSGQEPGASGLKARLDALGRSGELRALAEKHGAGAMTLEDVLSALVQPGRDPRDELDPPQLRSDVLSVNDLREGMVLEGTVRNVVDFGAFVDIGVKQDGLVHVSEMADRFIKNPYDVVGVGDRVKVAIVSIDKERGRIGLSMKQASGR
ncbi:RNA-binding transcriptional accessory protein [Lujinxingia litoralis]|uniref:RNA-binding transcriptional accessory protein n=1 Tax=Lujinxingia litoralis TaxID=2211119 RepID=A0A328CCF7_9DELT|nr:Tex family protein [Lujinxingia litoralis]RAL25340.1 RNA-binding transcriptional accessory protein [Lujinxingia litoralis]